MDPWRGHALAYQTAQYALGGLGFKVADGHFKQHSIKHSGRDVLPASLTLSSLGVGTYLGDRDEATDEAVTHAVVRSVANGWNVIDTAANYRGGRAEGSVGRALNMLRMTSGAEREMLFISTKAGFVSDSLTSPLLEAKKIGAHDVIDGHCIHPNCLEASLNRSLKCLGLATVDLFYIHNSAERQLQVLGQDEYMKRLKEAFLFCESARQQGKIKAYGMATWSCFRVPPEDKEQYLALKSVLQLAKEVGGDDHGFRYIMVPINAHMKEAWFQHWQEGEEIGRLVTLLEAAQQFGIGVFGAGPLMEAQLLSKPQLMAALDALPHMREVEGRAPKLLQLARSTPGLLSALVGHKNPSHVESNLAVGRHPLLSMEEYEEAMQAIQES